MATARALLRRLLAGARGRQGGAGGGGGTGAWVATPPSAEDRLDAARQRLKQTIAPPGEAAAAGEAGAERSTTTAEDVDDPDVPHEH